MSNVFKLRLAKFPFSLTSKPWKKKNIVNKNMTNNRIETYDPKTWHMKIENIRFIKTKYLLKHLETRRPNVCPSNVVAWLSKSMLIVVGGCRCCCSCHTVAIAIDMTRVTKNPHFFLHLFSLTIFPLAMSKEKLQYQLLFCLSLKSCTS
jgi:hypothetical protein